MKKVIIVVLISCLFLSFNIPVFAQRVQQTEKADREIDKDKALREKIEKERKKPEIVDKTIPPKAPAIPQEKALIKEITVTGATLISDKEVNDIIQPYIGKELTVAEMQKIADLITDAYRQKGYVTSRAYLPPQQIERQILEIRIVEGITGNVEIKGNRYFKKKLYRNKIALKNGEPFDYEALRKGMSKINQLPDRHAKAVLAPGKEAGTTDVILEVEDRLPFHVKLDFDNYGSRYVNQFRARTTITHNNLLGLDDVFNFQYQISESENYKLMILRYILPLTQSLKLGMFAADSDIDLRYEFEDEDLNARGKSRLYSIYLTQSLINLENFLTSLTVGFDYKDTFNFQQGVETSRDRMRVAKASLDVDLTDAWGRTMVGNEISYGIGDVMGGLQDRDALHASRNGAGGKFLKNNLYLLRLQRLPFNSTMLWKNQAQFTPYILTATEQFQTGGIVNVRGYPNAEAVGDRGYSMVWELSMPPYFISKNLKFPFSKAKVYDALRIVTFYDWSNTRLIRPTATEEKSTTLRGAGCGVRINLPEDFAFRVEVAWPLDRTPSDGDNVRTWGEITKSF